MIMTRRVAALPLTIVLCLDHVFLVNNFYTRVIFFYLYFLVNVILVYLNVHSSRSLP